MNWFDAVKNINSLIIPGTDLNTENSTWRKVISSDFSQNENENNYGSIKVRCGEKNNVIVSKEMLFQCFEFLVKSSRYDGKAFRTLFPKEVKNKSCYVHIIGMIFVKSQIAQKKDNYYVRVGF